MWTWFLQNGHDHKNWSQQYFGFCKNGLHLMLIGVQAQSVRTLQKLKLLAHIVDKPVGVVVGRNMYKWYMVADNTFK